MSQIYNTNIEKITPLIPPEELKEKLPISNELTDFIAASRLDIEKILHGEDNRLLVIVGPCSIHDPDAGYEYAQKLLELKKSLSSRIFMVMRVYFEKPRTRTGWRGMIVDPHLDGSYCIEEGLIKARDLLLKINAMGIPTASEILDPIVPQYISDLISWAAIGARTTESQIHREISSGLSMPVGFKNSTDGSMENAVNAIISARNHHSFIGIDQDGSTCVFHTKGNKTGHLILRGGHNRPNYYEENIEDAEHLLAENKTYPAILIDCSHANSGKKFHRQERVLNAVLNQRNRGRLSIRGIMLESNLHEGCQDMTPPFEYGVSITDSCIGWDETARILTEADNMLADK